MKDNSLRASFPLVLALTLSAIVCQAQQRQSRSGPRLEGTLHWMQNTLAAHGEVAQLASIQFDGCKITSTIRFTGYEMQEMDTFNLGDIDPESLPYLHI